ncbi:MAG: prepilin-type N-terminal cleavage/methylation domain-containing protein [Fimbriimonadaceae bacterium]
MKRKAFTLIEVTIVVLLIAILMGIAVPQFLKSRAAAQTRTCVRSLRAIENAKEMWAMATRQPEGATPVAADLVPDFLKKVEVCPAGGTYDFKAVGTRATCTVGNPHSL